MSDQEELIPEELPEGKRELSILSLLRGLVKHRASDLHIKVGRPPLYRVNGKILPSKLPALTAEEVKRIAYSTMTQKQIMDFEEKLQVDFGYALAGLARFRANVYMQRGTPAIVIRMVPLEVPLLDTLGLPAIIKEMALKPRGLLLVTGATGSGKSSTLAAVVEHINRNLRSHIITIEDPIEYIYEDKSSTVSQREVGVDASSMAQALKGAMRQDPDVIMVGEMRDYETMQTAISAAETGHLVISTMHTHSAAKSLDRMMDSFPAEARSQLRLQLAGCLLGVVTQRLIRRADGEGRAIACEILTRSPTVEKLILENKLHELSGVMESSKRYFHMQSMNQSLEQLVRDNIITKEEALLQSDSREDLELKLSGMIGGGQNGVDADELIGQAEESTRALKVAREGWKKGSVNNFVAEKGDATSGVALEDTLLHKRNRELAAKKKKAG